MWVCSGQTVQMTEGDFGIELPITVHGTTFAANDELRVKIASGERVLVEKTFSNPDQTVDLILTEAESALLPVGTYQYSLDWYQDGVFMCNVIPRSPWRVVDKL